MVAAVSLNIFHKYTYRLKMANIAQMVNVLQSVILTRDDEMVLTPTYHLFKMYIPHQGAEYLPLHYESKQLRDKNNRVVNTLSATASRAEDGTVTITLANVDLVSDCRITISLDDDKKYDVSHLQDEIGYQLFLQFMFYKQWMGLKEYANKKNVLIMVQIWPQMVNFR